MSHIPKVLIVTYNWPPRNSIGTHRPYSWAKYWAAQGVSVTVLTADKYSFDEPLDLRLAEIPGVEVVSVPYLPDRLKSNRRSKSPTNSTNRIAAVFRFLKRVRALASKVFGVNVDVRGRWTGPAFARACDLHAESGFDVVVSTYGPAASHRIAARLRRRYSDIRWVADYRDLWSGNPTAAKLFGWWRRRIEKRFCADADSITTVSAGLAAELRNVHGRHITVVPNGFDARLVDIQNRLASRAGLTQRDSKPYSVVYTGNFYLGLQDPRPLFRAVRSLIDSQEICVDSLTIDFYGGMQAGLQRLVNDSGADSFVKLHGYVARDEALRLQEQASAVLLLEVLRARTGGVLTGKLFEYMASGTPVISVGDGSDQELGRMIEETGIGVFAGNSDDLLQSAIVSIMSSDSPTWFTPNLDNISTYSRQASAQKMLNVLGYSYSAE